MADELRHSEQDLTGDERLAAYFLGELPEEEGEIIERQLFNDTELAARAFAVEDELVNDYARGGLSPAQRRAFEQNYLVTEERQARLEFARNLVKQWQAANPISPSVEVRATEKPRWWQSFFAPRQLVYAALLLIILFGWWRWTIRQQALPELAVTFTPTPLPSPMPSSSLTVTASPTTTPVALPSPKLVPNVFASITLAGGTVRTGVPGQAVPTLKLSLASVTNAARVELKLLLLEHNSPSYRAALQNQTGQTIWQAAGLKPQPQAANPDTPLTLITQVPANLLSTGDYVLLLTAKRPTASEPTHVESYTFRVLRK